MARSRTIGLVVAALVVVGIAAFLASRASRESDGPGGSVAVAEGASAGQVTLDGALSVADRSDDAAREPVAEEGAHFRGRLVAPVWGSEPLPVADMAVRLRFSESRSSAETLLEVEATSDDEGWIELPLPFGRDDFVFANPKFMSMCVELEPLDPAIEVDPSSRRHWATWRDAWELVDDEMWFDRERHLFHVRVVDEDGAPVAGAAIDPQLDHPWWDREHVVWTRVVDIGASEPARAGEFEVRGDLVGDDARFVVAATLGDSSETMLRSDTVRGVRPGDEVVVVLPTRRSRVTLRTALGEPITSNQEYEFSLETVLEQFDLALAPKGAAVGDEDGRRWIPMWSERAEPDGAAIDAGVVVAESREHVASVARGVYDLRLVTGGRVVQVPPLVRGIAVDGVSDVDLGTLELSSLLHLFVVYLPWRLEQDPGRRLLDVTVDGERTLALPVDVGRHASWYLGSGQPRGCGYASVPLFSPVGSGRRTHVQGEVEVDDGGSGGFFISRHPVMASRAFGPALHPVPAGAPVDWLGLLDSDAEPLGWGTARALSLLLRDIEGFEMVDDDRDDDVLARYGLAPNDIEDPETGEPAGEFALLVSTLPSPQILFTLPGRASQVVTLVEGELNRLDAPPAPASGLVVRFPEARGGWRYGVRLLDWRGDPWAVAPGAIALPAGERELSLAFEAEDELRFVPCAWRDDGTTSQACSAWVTAPRTREEFPDPLEVFWPPWVPPPASGFEAKTLELARSVRLARGVWTTVEVPDSLDALHDAFDVVRLAPARGSEPR
ncbi:MAG: hypothetical protein R3F34_13395 [Planctomycetota bacterium]